MERGVHRQEPHGALKTLSKVRPFTLRLPEELYLAVADRAVASSKTNNATVIELLEIGLGKKMDVRKALQDLLAREFPDDAIETVNDAVPA
jgi:threonyl-tRNA synthetase